MLHRGNVDARGHGSGKGRVTKFCPSVTSDREWGESDSRWRLGHGTRGAKREGDKSSRGPRIL